MKKHVILLALLLCGGVLRGQAREKEREIPVREFRIERHGGYMAVEMVLDFGSLHVESNRALLLTPAIGAAGDTLLLPSVGIYGRRRYYHYLREGGGMLSGAEETVLKAGGLPDTLAYRTTVPYEKWMDGASLLLRRGEYGCCHTLLEENLRQLAVYKAPAVRKSFVPRPVYVQPEREAVKLRNLSGSAFIDFPVNRTEIFEEYRDNAAELAKIRATIDSVRGDADVRFRSLSFKGFASPEGSYANNSRLARERTEALRRYVAGLYDFPRESVSTAFEPENWEGLRRFVEESALPHKDEILELIDSDREPDNKEWKLKTTYPQEYRHLLERCYPALRRSDYRVEYEVRHFTDTDAEHILELAETRPQNLSLEEFHIAARHLPAGSERFNRLFETAVRMFPHDETANLNAANSAMLRGDTKEAARYLSRAGETPEAVYARGLLAAMQGDYAGAEAMLRSVAEVLPQAEEALQQIGEITDSDR